MGLREHLKGKHIYFDANIFIYLMEGYSELAVSVQAIRDSIYHNEAKIFTSELTLCEVLVPAFKLNKPEIIALYQQFIEESGAFELIPTSRDIYICSSFFRAQLGLKTPDAIHVASALKAECSIFITNDKTIKTPKGLEIILLCDPCSY